MNTTKIRKLLNNDKIIELRKEALKRGYKSGASITYGYDNERPHQLGKGKFCINNSEGYPRLIKIDNNFFDVIFDEDGWTKIAKLTNRKP